MYYLLQKSIIRQLSLIGFCCHLFLTVATSQCYPDRHNTTWYDGWTSCEKSANPNDAREASHWILYNFGKTASFGDLQVWNANDPKHIENGIKRAILDYSSDGVSWETWGEITLEAAGGSSTYEGQIAADLGGISAQYLLITALENHGGDCFGLSEVRFYLTEAVSEENTTPSRNQAFCLSAQVFPNPFESSPTLALQSNCGTDVKYSVRDAMGRLILEHRLDGVVTHVDNQLSTASWAPGIYFLNITHGNKKQILKLVKIQ